MTGLLARDWLGWGDLTVIEQINVAFYATVFAVSFGGVALWLMATFGWAPPRPAPKPKTKAKPKPKPKPSAKAKGRKRRRG